MGTATASRATDVHRLRAEIARMQRRRAETPLLRLDSALRGLLPEEGLRRGSVYSLDSSPALLGALLAGPSREGSWCAVVGMPRFGLEAAAAFGVDLSRVVLVPAPGERWLSIVSALSEVIPLIALAPGRTVSAAEESRMGARLRDRGTTLLVTAPWPEAVTTIRIEARSWHGLEEGRGVLRGQEATLSALTRYGEGQRIRVLLPGARGTAEALPEPSLRPMSRGSSDTPPAGPGRGTGRSTAGQGTDGTEQNARETRRDLIPLPPREGSPRSRRAPQDRIPQEDASANPWAAAG